MKVDVLFAAASIAALTTLVMAAPVQAATLTYDFTVNVGSGELAGNQYSGFFSFDDASLTGIGAERIALSQGLALSFNFLGRTYTQASDFGFPDYPIVDFLDGTLQGLSFAVFDPNLSPNFNSLSIGNPIQGSDAGGTYFIYGQAASTFTPVGEGSVSYQQRNPVPVPTPALLPGLIGMGLAALKKRRDEASKAA